MQTRLSRIFLAAASVLTLGSLARAQSPLSTAFTYQGELTQFGGPANGAFDLRFRLYELAAGGLRVGDELCADDVVVTNGKFTVALDFGAQFTGQMRWIELEVRADTGASCSDMTGYELLAPRQELTATPNATFAVSAGAAASANTANFAVTAGSADTATNASLLNGQSAAFYTDAFNLTGMLPGSVLAGVDGSGLINLSGASIQPGTITRAGVNAELNSILSQWTALPPQTGALRDAIAWGDNEFGQNNVPALPPGLAYTAVAAGSQHLLARRSDGAVVAWGRNDLDQATVPAGLTNVTAIAAGGVHSLALRSDGTVLAWGAGTIIDLYPNLGQSIVPQLPPGVTYTAIAAGSFHSLAARSDGTVVAFGDNGGGQTDVPAGLTGVTAVAAGGGHSLALLSDGTVVAWGRNVEGQTDIPAGLDNVTAIAAGENHSIALRSNGTVVAWGWTNGGISTVPADLTNVIAVAGGTFHSVALRSDGTIVGWGINFHGETQGPALPEGLRYSGVSAGRTGSVALRSDTIPLALSSTVGLSVGSGTPRPEAGGLSVAGASTFGSTVTAASFVGSGSGLTGLNATNISSGVLNSARMPTNWAAGGDLGGFYPNPAINAGAVTRSKLSSEVQGILSQWTAQPSEPGVRDAIVWGRDNEGQTNIAPLPPGVTYTTVSGGAYHTLALRSNGTLVAWGSNAEGQTDVPPLPPGVTYTAVSAGQHRNLAVLSNGTVVEWGLIEVLPPWYESPELNFGYTAVACGWNHSLALRNDGTVLAWGENDFGQTDVPELPFGMSYTALSAGDGFSVALRSDGNVVAWGRNDSGQTYAPFRWSWEPRFTSVSAGRAHGVAMRSDGRMYPWGAPTLPLLPNIISASAGGDHTLALRSDGTVVAGGANNSGQINVPVLPDGFTYTSVSAGGFHSFAQRSQTIPAAQASATGLSIGSGAPRPPTGGLSVAGASIFGGTIQSTGTANTYNGMIETNYGRPNDRYGIGQFPGGVMGVYTAGFFQSSSIQFGQMTGSTSFAPQMTIAKSGNVGIGLTDPGFSLDVRSATPAIRVGDASAGKGAIFFGNTNHGVRRDYGPGNSGNDVGLYTSAADLYLSADGASTSQFVLKNSGNIGIGGEPATTNTKLTIHQGYTPLGTQQTNLLLSQPQCGWGTSAEFATYRYIKTDACSNNEGFFKQFNVAPGGVSIGYPNTPAYGSSDGLYVNGNVGIGTTSPGTNKLQVVGTFTATTKNFTIDHPLDPANKLLAHSTIESDEYKNLYDGTVMTDADGLATLTLPDWFEALNENFRYQITVIDEAAPDVHFVRVASKISGGTFVIKSIPGNMEISWQVTGTRKDAFVKAHPLQVEQDKAGGQKGKYFHPQEHGQPVEMGVGYTPPSAPSAAQVLDR
jgi:alpha-tubulin suppressor-like RCC1 family protein